MAEINLLKNELQGKGIFSFASFGPKGLVPLYTALGILVFELLVYGGMVYYGKNLDKKALEYEQQAAAVDMEIGKVDKDRRAAVSFQQRLNNLQVLLNNHQFWFEVMDELAKYTVKTVQFEAMQAAPCESKISIMGSVPSYTELGKFLIGLRQSPRILDLDLKTTAQSGKEAGGYRFNLVLFFDPELLLK